MSVRDAKALLEDGTYLFFFLPGINYTYILTVGIPLVHLSGDIVWILSASAILMGSFVYNYSIGMPEEANPLLKLGYLVSLLILVFYLLHSTVILGMNMPSNNGFGGALLFLSGCLLALVVTHNLIGKFSEGYDNEI